MVVVFPGGLDSVLSTSTVNLRRGYAKMVATHDQCQKQWRQMPSLGCGPSLGCVVATKDQVVPTKDQVVQALT